METGVPADEWFASADGDDVKYAKDHRTVLLFVRGKAVESPMYARVECVRDASNRHVAKIKLVRGWAGVEKVCKCVPCVEDVWVLAGKGRFGFKVQVVGGPVNSHCRWCQFCARRGKGRSSKC